MLNKKPIFLNGFARGGTNLLVNLLISHPDICISSGETHKVFKPGTRFDKGWLRIKKRLLYDYPIRILAGQDIFNAHGYKPRKKVPYYLRPYIDQIFYHGRFIANIETHNLFRYPGVKYSRKQLEDCRLLSKGLDGIVFTVDLLNEMYPDATFIAMVRNGLAICEGRVRRGYQTVKMAHEFNAVVDQMFLNNRKLSNYSIVRYEDMVSDPQSFMLKLYQLCQIDLNQLGKVRLESKAVMDKEGHHKLLKGHDRQVFWYDFENLHEHIRSDINKNQIRQLSKKDREIFLSIAGENMAKLGYSY